MLANVKIENILRELDLDGDGNIDFDEFITASTDHRKLLSPLNIRYVFNLIDKDRDNLLKIEEF